LIDVDRDLFGAALGGDVLSAGQLRAAAVACKADQVLCYQRHRSPRALLPRRVGRRVDDDLTDDPPARVVRIAARYKKPCERLRHPQRSWLGPVAVEMSQCGANVTAILDRAGELTRGPPRLALFIVDPSTVLAGLLALGLGSSQSPESPSSVESHESASAGN
jgi:hypothetical protein